MSKRETITTEYSVPSLTLKSNCICSVHYPRSSTKNKNTDEFHMEKGSNQQMPSNNYFHRKFMC